VVIRVKKREIFNSINKEATFKSDENSRSELRQFFGKIPTF
jgi:hypothetical protein